MADRERVLVLYNEPVLPESHPDYISEIEIMDNVIAVQEVLREAGYEVDELPANPDPCSIIDGIRKFQPDVVFNLFEGFANNNASELYGAGLLEWMGVSYTGCPFHTLVLARSKHLAKRLFLADGLPTAPFMVIENQPPVSCSLNFPVIVKPAQQDASVGVEQRSVCTDLASLQKQVKYVLDQFGPPVMVEEFIFGRELTFALVEMPQLQLLPATEAVFPDGGPGYWPILTYDAKWTRGSPEFETTDYHFKAELSSELMGQIEVLSRQAFRLLGCRDYARVDFRLRQGDNKPYILEVNPNPDFAPDRALSNNLWAAGFTHPQFTVQMVKNALARRNAAGPERYRDQRQAG